MRFSGVLLVALQAACISAAGWEGHRRNRTAQAFASSADGKLRFSAVAPPIYGGSTKRLSFGWELFIDDSEEGFKQTVTGFGGTVTDVTVAAYNSLPSASRAQLLALLVTPEGANFTLIRHTIGSSDMTPGQPYTYADNGGKPDPTLASFDLGDRGRRMLSMLQDMKRIKPSMFLVGTPWAPPAWMRPDNASTGSASAGKTLNDQYAIQFSSYLVKYLQAYTNSGVPVNAITIQNEPAYNEAGKPGFSISADAAASLIQDHLQPAVLANGLTPEIWAHDQNTDQAFYAQKVVFQTEPVIKAVAWHCYAPQENWTALADFHRSLLGKEQYMTDCWTSVAYTKWNQASWFTIGPLQNWASGSIARALGTYSANRSSLDAVGSCQACTGLFTVDAERGTFELRPDYYILGQYSRYIPRGAIILHGNGSSTEGSDVAGIESVASINPDGTRTVVMENRFARSVKIVLTSRSGEIWVGPVSPRSVTTWVLPSI